MRNLARKSVWVGLALTLGATAGATEPGPLSQNSIDLLLNDYLLEKTAQPFQDKSATPLQWPPGCIPPSNGSSCSSYVADRAGTSNETNLINIARACRGNMDAACVKYVAERSGTRNLENLISVAMSCSGAYGEECTSFIAERAGTSNLENLKRVSTACRNVYDTECVRELARRSGTSNLENLIRFAQACGGN